jgi:hypothetical protein
MESGSLASAGRSQVGAIARTESTPSSARPLSHLILAARKKQLSEQNFFELQPTIPQHFAILRAMCLAVTCVNVTPQGGAWGQLAMPLFSIRNSIDDGIL